jgi:hypothetical protein
MSLLVVATRVPSPSEAAFADAARATGLAMADVRERLAGQPPRVLLVEVDDDRARETAATLEQLGFGVVTCDPRTVPADDERLVARSLGITQAHIEATDAHGDTEELTPAAVLLIQVGARVVTTIEKSEKSERRLALGRALLSGGLLLTKKVKTEIVRTTTAEDPFVLLHRSDGGRDVMIYERRIDYRCLAGERGPSSHGNFQRLIARLRAHFPRAAFDDRVLRPGLVSRLAAISSNPVDLALQLVLLTRLRDGSV